eukprot:2119472-Amphidinium_carterae.1
MPATGRDAPRKEATTKRLHMQVDGSKGRTRKERQRWIARHTKIACPYHMLTCSPLGRGQCDRAVECAMLPLSYPLPHLEARSAQNAFKWASSLWVWCSNSDPKTTM